jgi:cytochrome c
MDSFTLNKIAGAFLGTCLLGMGLGVIADFIYGPGVPAKPGYALPEGKPEGAAAADAKQPEAQPLPVLLAKADPKKGEADTKVCGACHNFQEGAGAKVGPDLYGVVGRPKGSAPGFEYSAGMKAKGGDWTFEDLNAFITKPSAYVQGTKMGYAGEDNPEKRADIISYLRTLSKSPVPLPAAAPAPAAK